MASLSGQWSVISCRIGAGSNAAGHGTNRFEMGIEHRTQFAEKWFQSRNFFRELINTQVFEIRFQARTLPLTTDNSSDNRQSTTDP